MDPSKTDIIKLVPPTGGIDRPMVMIGIASWRGGIEPETQMCLDRMVIHNLQHGLLSPVKKTTGSMISSNRNTVIRSAIEKKMKYLLMLDTDMLFEQDSIMRMVEKMETKKVPVISALAHAKQEPFAPNMYKKLADNSWVPITKWKKGDFLKVDTVGGAFMLLDVEAIKHIPEPWFADPPVSWHVAWEKLEKILFPQGNMSDKEIIRAARFAYREDVAHGCVLGEDYFFCELLRQYNIPIHVDTTLKIGHMGKCNFTYDDFATSTGDGEIE